MSDYFFILSKYTKLFANVKLYSGVCITLFHTFTTQYLHATVDSSPAFAHKWCGTRTVQTPV